MSINGRELLRQSVLDNWGLWKTKIDGFHRYFGSDPAPRSKFEYYSQSKWLSELMPTYSLPEVEAVATLMQKKITESFPIDCSEGRPTKFDNLFAKIKQSPYLKSEAEKEIRRIEKQIEQIKNIEGPSVYNELSKLRRLVDKIVEGQSGVEEENEISGIVATVRNLREVDSVVRQNKLAELTATLVKMKEESSHLMLDEVRSLEKRHKKISKSFKEIIPSQIQAIPDRHSGWFTSSKHIRYQSDKDFVIACCKESTEITLENAKIAQNFLENENEYLQGYGMMLPKDEKLRSSVNLTRSVLEKFTDILECNQIFDRQIQTFKKEFNL